MRRGSRVRKKAKTKTELDEEVRKKEEEIKRRRKKKRESLSKRQETEMSQKKEKKKKSGTKTKANLVIKEIKFENLKEKVSISVYLQPALFLIRIYWVLVGRFFRNAFQDYLFYAADKALHCATARTTIPCDTCRTCRSRLS